MLLVAASLFFTTPAPLAMPQATAYLVTQGDAQRIEDRFNILDLWTSKAVLGRWIDDDGRRFTLAKLDTIAPKLDLEKTKTRGTYYAETVHIPAKDKVKTMLFEAAEKIVPFEMPEEPVRPHQDIRGMKEVWYVQGTNTFAVSALFLPKKASAWYLATWELIEDDEFEYSRELFEEEFLGKWSKLVKSEIPSEIDFASAQSEEGRTATKRKVELPNEKELLRIDAKHSITNYSNWNATDSDEFVVLDDAVFSRGFIVTLTNDLKRMRARYAEVVPAAVDCTNVLAVARIYSNRDEYLDAIEGDDMEWSAAYWSPARRELVAYLPEEGGGRLLETIRHEAFHQYLSYAGAMLTASAWFNEGYAQYFENEENASWEMGETFMPNYEELAELLPSLMMMDYEAFYSGDEFARRLKYRLAWSMAYFIENGAEKVRFQPFKNLKRDYMAALVKSRGDMQYATAAAFGTPERINLFILEWKKFWKNR